MGQRLLAFSGLFLLLPLISCPAGQFPGTCERFVLSVSGRKQDNDQWDAVYDIQRSSSSSTKNWNLFITKNVTVLGSAQYIHLRGYFTDSEKHVDKDDPNPITFDRCSSITSCSSKPDTDCRFSRERSSSTESDNLKIISRSHWNARNSTKPLHRFSRPVTSLNIYYDTPNCATSKECVKALREVQSREITVHGDIYGNFHSGGDGRIYEGIGWDHTMNGEMNLVYLTSGENNPTPQQFASFALLIREGIRRGKISREYELWRMAAERSRQWMNWINDLLSPP